MKQDSLIKIQKISVIGGGPAGLATSLALRDYGFDVTLLEASAYDKYCPGEHIISAAKTFLQQLSIPDELIQKHSLKCYEVLSSWGGEEVFSNDSIYNQYGESYIISRPAFDKDLAEHALSKGVKVECNAQVDHLIKGKKNWQIEYRQKGETHKLQSDFVVDATGRNTKFASAFGVQKNRYDNLMGVSVFYKPGKGANIPKGTVQIEAFEKGWWYFTLLQDDSLILTLMTDADIIKNIGGMENAIDHFMGSSQQAKTWLKGYLKVGKPQMVSAKSQITSKITGENWMMVGDSAWSIDPLSSQGIYKAMDMGLKAAEAIHGHFSRKPKALADYSSHFTDMFYSYMGLRAKYYRMETRWRREDFWKRRHNPCWLEIPISMDPMKRISISSENIPPIKDHLKWITPSIDVDLLYDVLASNTTVVDAASSYRLQAEHPSEDKELIIAIQEVLIFN